jgi:creatinine amidohydrolase
VGAVLPGLPYGATPYFSELPGCFALQPETVRGVLADVVAELARNGVERCVVVNNNYTPEQLASIYAVAADARERLGFRVHYMDITHPWRQRAAELPQAFVEGDFHAGSYETSLMMASDPSLVDEDVRTALLDLPIDLVQKIREGQTSIHKIGAGHAYIGFPARATAAEGRQAYANLCAMLVAAIEAMLSGAEPREPGWYARAASPAG